MELHWLTRFLYRSRKLLLDRQNLRIRVGPLAHANSHPQVKWRCYSSNEDAASHLQFDFVSVSDILFFFKSIRHF